ncbi:MAG: PA14 domain-containing protein, partial [Actinomycetota bacterium]|nr:PA14 domain-containing protein [Actinomycetota bacterium]
MRRLTPSHLLASSSRRFARLALALVLSAGCLLAGAPRASADFAYEVYSGIWDVLPDFGLLTPIETGGTSPTIGVSVTSETNYFGLVFTNQINVPTSGDYEFYTNSDDGSILYIDGQVVVDNDGLHGPRTVANSVTLTAGLHDLRVEFFEKGGGEVIEVG